jgi:hypothetical protein
MKQRESTERGEKLLAEYHASKQTRRAFCDQQGIRVTTLDYYLGRARQRRKREAGLVRVEVQPKKPPAAGEVGSGVAIAWNNGCRVELERGFDEVVLRRVLALLGGE